MEKGIRSLLNESLAGIIASRYMLKHALPAPISQHHNFIYKVRQHGVVCVLRIVHSKHKPHDVLQAELDAVLHARCNGVSAPNVLASPHGNQIEIFDDGNGGNFFGIVSEFIDGAKLSFSNLDRDFFCCLGDTCGRLHKAFSSYGSSTSSVGCNRHRGMEWYYDFLAPTRYVPGGGGRMMDALSEARCQIDSLVKNEKNFKFVHNDIHPGNIIRSGERSYVIDFDDSHFNYIDTDLANILLILLDTPTLFAARGWSVSRDEVFDHFCRYYIPAYGNHANFSYFSIASINAFLMRRIAAIYASLHRDACVDGASGNVMLILSEYERCANGEVTIISDSQIDRLMRAD